MQLPQKTLTGSPSIDRNEQEAVLATVVPNHASNHITEESVAPGTRSPELAELEAILFSATEPITPRKLLQLLPNWTSSVLRQRIEALNQHYLNCESPFEIVEIAEGYQLLTLPQYYPWLLRLRRHSHDCRLSALALETLAIIADKQPIMRAEIDAIRGVSSAEILHTLMDKGYIKIAGRHDSLGRPQLYCTTRRFLEIFGLMSIQEAQLPRVGEK